MGFMFDFELSLCTGQRTRVGDSVLVQGTV